MIYLDTDSDSRPPSEPPSVEERLARIVALAHDDCYKIDGSREDVALQVRVVLGRLLEALNAGANFDLVVEKAA